MRMCRRPWDQTSESCLACKVGPSVLLVHVLYVASVFTAQQCYVLKNAIVRDGSEGASGSTIKCQE